jgi:glycosyltransferase involved in cell wall biosynthesis
MKIALIDHYSLRHGGGGERFLTDLANFLNARGNVVKVHSLPIRARGATIDLAREISYCESLLHLIDADVYYFMYAPLTQLAFLRKNNCPKIAGLHGLAMSDCYQNPVYYVKQIA